MREIVRAAGAALIATPQEQEMTYRIEFGSWPKAAANILRIARIALALMLAQIAQLSGARAHITCLKIDELRTNDPAIVALVERHYGTKDFFVGTLDRRFYVVRLGPADCGYPTCIHRVIQVIDGAVHERLAFDATGWVFCGSRHTQPTPNH